MGRIKGIKIMVPVLLLALCISGCASEEKQAATEAFHDEVTRIESQITDFNTLIEASEEVVKTEDIALDETLRQGLETAISNAKVAVDIEIPKMQRKVEEIENQTAALKEIDLEEDMNALASAKAAFEDSIKQYKQVTNPSESFVIERLTGIDHIANISAVTEDNDPNGNLNKPGGYTATVYYSDDRISLDTMVYGKTVIDQGTQGGGAVEVYANVADAEKRNDYLANFDGTFTASGSHIVVGTVLVRTSDELTASKQKEMEALIVEALTRLDD